MAKKVFFTKHEDELILEALEKFGSRNGFEILTNLLNRPKRKIMERYSNTLNPELIHIFSESDDMLLIRLFKEKGKHWTEIGRLMGNRSGNSIKSRHNMLMAKLKRGMIREDGSRTRTFVERRHSKRTTRDPTEPHKKKQKEAMTNDLEGEVPKGAIMNYVIQNDNEFFDFDDWQDDIGYIGI